jgi:hypothetical protein
MEYRPWLLKFRYYLCKVPIWVTVCLVFLGKEKENAFKIFWIAPLIVTMANIETRQGERIGCVVSKTTVWYNEVQPCVPKKQVRPHSAKQRDMKCCMLLKLVGPMR